MKHLPYELGDNRAVMHRYRTSKLLEIAYTAKEMLGKDHPCALDLGCGRGELLKGLGEIGYETFGMDVDPECVRMSKSFGEVLEGDILDAEKLFHGRAFDLVVSSHMLEHTENPPAALRIMKKMVGNYLLLAVPNVFYSVSVLSILILGRIPPTNPGHICEWDPSNFKNLVENLAGYRILAWHHDWVKCVPSRLRKFFDRLRILQPLESRIAVRLVPQVSESLIVLCDVPVIPNKTE